MQDCLQSVWITETLKKDPYERTAYNTLITAFGLRRVKYFGDFIHVITLDDLFKAM